MYVRRRRHNAKPKTIDYYSRLGIAFKNKKQCGKSGFFPLSLCCVLCFGFSLKIDILLNAMAINYLLSVVHPTAYI